MTKKSLNFNSKEILTLFLKPKYDPTNTSGTDTPNHIARRATSVVKGIAAELCLAQRRRFRMKTMVKIKPGIRTQVRIRLDFHFSPPNAKKKKKKKKKN